MAIIGKLEKEEVCMNYVLGLPNNAEATYPLILFLHGVAERGNDAEMLTKSPQLLNLEEASGSSFMVVAPQCPGHSSWDRETDAVMALLDEMIRQYPVDSNKVYLTGISMGGYGAWDLAIKHPDRFAAVAPICGGGEPEKVHVLKRLPVWTFHGAEDEIVPPQETLDMVDALKKCDGNVEVTIYPDRGHDLTDTYRNPKLYDWFLQFRSTFR